MARHKFNSKHVQVYQHWTKRHSKQAGPAKLTVWFGRTLAPLSSDRHFKTSASQAGATREGPRKRTRHQQASEAEAPTMLARSSQGKGAQPQAENRPKGRKRNENLGKEAQTETRVAPVGPPVRTTRSRAAADAAQQPVMTRRYLHSAMQSLPSINRGVKMDHCQLRSGAFSRRLIPGLLACDE